MIEMTEDLDLVLAERVAAGVEFMDTIDPDWFWIVDPRELSIGSYFHCILGQHSGEGAYDPTAYGLSWNDTGLFGFDVENLGQAHGYSTLDVLWREAIWDRRAAWFEAHPEAVSA